MIETNGKKIFEAVGADAVFTTCDYLRRYVTSFFTEGGFVITDKDGTSMYTDARYTEAARKALAGTEVAVKEIDRFSRPVELLKKYKTVGIPFELTFYPEYKKLEELGLTLVDSMPAFQSCMALKNASELAAIGRACDIAEEGLLKLLPEIKEGMTEAEVAALLEYNMRTLGAYSTSFDTIVAFGPHAAVPHHETGNTRLKFGDEILIDFGCKMDGYCSDITRTVLFGDDKKHGKFKKAYEAVLAAHNLVKEKLTAGMTGGEADAIARDYLEEKGYGKYFTHSLGHGIGLNIHEFPSVRKGGTDVLKNGMVFSDEPGVYLAGEYGVRIEDTVTLKDGKVSSFMHKTDRNLVIL